MSVVMSACIEGGIAQRPSRNRDCTPRQIEFELPVAVCAWCQPHGRNPAGQIVSHGICPRHSREMKQELERQRSGRRQRAVAASVRFLAALSQAEFAQLVPAH